LIFSRAVGQLRGHMPAFLKAWIIVVDLNVFSRIEARSLKKELIL
jgi:hypothetical protein